jgi:hypothetical protein
MRARLFGTLDLIFAAAYAYVGFALAPSRQLGFGVALGLVCALLALSGIGLLLRGRNDGPARTVGIIASSVLLLFAVVVIALLCASASFLFGVYGALGHGIGVLSLVAAALVLEVCGLLPLFQLAFHLDRSRAA